MIRASRVVEILQQCANDDYLRKDGERNAYMDFFMDLEGESDRDKISTYLDNEKKATRISMDSGKYSYEGWRRALGKLDAIDKIERALEEYGE